MPAPKRKKSRKPTHIDWNDLPSEHLNVAPEAGTELVVEAEPTTVWGKIRAWVKGAKTVILGGIILGVSAVAMFDPETLPLDAIIRIFVTDDNVAASVSAAVTVAFLAMRFISPGLLVGLRWVYKKNKES